MLIAQTPRLILRRLTLADADALLAVFGDAEVMRYGDGVRSLAWVLGWLADCLARYDQGQPAPWAIVERGGDDRAIGYCGLFTYGDVNGRPEVELGYRLARAYWGRGYATEAARAVLDYAFRVLGLARLIALIDPDNVASIRVAEKLGMTHEADALLPGYTHPDRVYAIALGPGIGDWGLGVRGWGVPQSPTPNP